MSSISSSASSKSITLMATNCWVTRLRLGGMVWKYDERETEKDKRTDYDGVVPFVYFSKWSFADSLQKNVWIISVLELRTMGWSWWSRWQRSSALIKPMETLDTISNFIPIHTNDLSSSSDDIPFLIKYYYYYRNKRLDLTLLEIWLKVEWLKGRMKLEVVLNVEKEKGGRLIWFALASEFFYHLRLWRKEIEMGKSH